MTKDLKEFEDKIDVHFTDKKLLQTVFVHRSYLNEHSDFELDHNERLEFLGDAVLELIVTDHLYKNYENPEGELTNWRSAVVRGQMLSELAQELDIDDYLYLSKGEAKSTGKARQIILANTFEALIGAIYLDQRYNETKKFVENILIVKLPEIIKNKLYVDAKSNFQELSQEKSAITPTYKVLSEAGPDHNKKFEVGVYIADKQVGVGFGLSKQEAEQKAAQNALDQ